MSLHLWLIYVSVLLAVIITPGSSAILCVSHGAAHGVVKTAATVLGGMCASLSLMMLSALGLGAAIAASDMLFQAIKYTGAAYLVYLGISIWRAPLQDFSTQAKAMQNNETVAMGALFRKGLIVGIGNPKDLLFFGSFFPQFLNASQPLVDQLLILALTWLVADAAVMLSYAKCGAAISLRLKSSKLGKTFNRITGGAFVAVGSALAVSNR